MVPQCFPCPVPSSSTVLCHFTNELVPRNMNRTSWDSIVSKGFSNPAALREWYTSNNPMTHDHAVRLDSICQNHPNRFPDLPSNCFTNSHKSGTWRSLANHGKSTYLHLAQRRKGLDFWDPAERFTCNFNSSTAPQQQDQQGPPNMTLTHWHSF